MRLIDDNGQMRFLDNRWLWPRKAGAAICALSRPTSAVYRFFGGEDRRVQSHLNGLCNQEQPRPGVAGGTLASKLPSLGFSPSRYLRATLGGTRGENSRTQLGSSAVPLFTSRRVTMCLE